MKTVIGRQHWVVTGVGVNVGVTPLYEDHPLYSQIISVPQELLDGVGTGQRVDLVKYKIGPGEKDTQSLWEKV